MMSAKANDERILEEDMTGEAIISADESWRNASRSRSRSPLFSKSELPLEVQLGTASQNSADKTNTVYVPITSRSGDISDDNSSPFTCDLCDRSFPNLTGLKTHIRSHKRNPEKSSEIPANKVPIERERNRRDTRLKETRREREVLVNPIVTPERGYTCGQCIESYISATDLYTHVTKIHGPHFEARNASIESPKKRKKAVETYWRDGMFYVCKFCGKSYLHIVGFRSHWRRHQREQLQGAKTLQMNISIPVPNSSTETFSAAVTLPLVDILE